MLLWICVRLYASVWICMCVLFCANMGLFFMPVHCVFVFLRRYACVLLLFFMYMFGYVYVCVSVCIHEFVSV